MKLFDILLGRKKAKPSRGNVPITPVRHPPEKKPSSAASSKPFPKKQPTIARTNYTPTDTPCSEPRIHGPVCANDVHVFSHPYPFTCRKCGLECRGNREEIVKYMGSYFNGVSYKWHPDMKKEEIVSFSLSTGDRPVFEANCDFSDLSIRNCLNGSRDGWMQTQFPADYFEPKAVKLEKADILKIKEHINTCDFSAWVTPDHYAENQIMGACGFHVDETFTCQFTNGRKFTCLKPDNPEFKQLVSLLRNMAEKNAKEEDQKFIKRMLQDTEKAEKQIYWLISCTGSMAKKWMDLMAQAAPFFNYIVARELSRGDNANVELMVNVMRFSDGAAWVTKSAVPESEYQWEPLPVGKGNDAGAAFSLLTQHFETLPEPKRKLFPIVALVLDGPITDDWLTAQDRFQSLPGVSKNVLTIALVMGDKVEKRFLKKFDGVIYHINSIEDIINEMDSPLFGY